MSPGVSRILIVDDEPDMCVFLSRVLEDHGYLYDTASDGEEALEKINAAPPDLVALDVTMPRKSGYHVYITMRQDPRLEKIPVVFITGAPDDLRRFISSLQRVPPPEAYIPKPIAHDEFITTVRKLLGQES